MYLGSKISSWQGEGKVEESDKCFTENRQWLGGWFLLVFLKLLKEEVSFS